MVVVLPAIKGPDVHASLFGMAVEDLNFFHADWRLCRGLTWVAARTDFHR